MKKRFLSKLGRISLIILWGLIFACATEPAKPTPSPSPAPTAPVPSQKDSYLRLADRYRLQAMEYEKSGELPRALQSWEVVNAFQPTDEEVAKKIVALKTQIKTLADQHFKKGLSYYQNRSIPPARKEFLITLYYNPDHTEALSYLKNKLTEEDYTVYEVMPGDTLEEIAKKVYHDPQKEFLIAYFNNLGKNPQLVPKTTLRLPIADIPQTKPPLQPREVTMDPKEILAEPKDVKVMMGKAMAYFKANKFRETTSITEEILSSYPSNKEARDLTNASYYQMGKVLHQGKKYPEALEQLSRVSPEYRDVKELIVSVKKQFAEAHYIDGIKYYTQEKLDQAIQEWQETLKLNPQHPKAKGDIENAERLLEKLKEIK